jgi:anti-sigma regulatory factor (Ser/Thr protein kinase)
VEATYEVDARLVDGVVEIEVRDFGRWRPPRDSDRGRGLPLMEGLTDEMDIRRDEAGTLVTMRRRLAAARRRPGDDA